MGRNPQDSEQWLSPRKRFLTPERGCKPLGFVFNCGRPLGSQGAVEASRRLAPRDGVNCGPTGARGLFLEKTRWGLGRAVLFSYLGSGKCLLRLARLRTNVLLKSKGHVHVCYLIFQLPEVWETLAVGRLLLRMMLHFKVVKQQYFQISLLSSLLSDVERPRFPIMG